MYKRFLFVIFFVSSFWLLSTRVFAAENPLTVPNNKFGIHILFPNELQKAATLVNSNGGEWGYVTIPIQSGDRDLDKWQKFMDLCRSNKVIPILRLATEGDYFNTKVWRKPDYYDIIDFANFLSSLKWPIKNRYVIIFNEVNRGDEWGGTPNPLEYARLLSYAVTVFKSKSQDFFIISSGLDNAAATVRNSSYNEYNFMRTMHASIPGIFYQVDGISSHSYPNPAFSQPPTKIGPVSVGSFRYENDLAQNLGGKELPVFITETGWTKHNLSDEIIASYYQSAFATIWSDAHIVAVTPFLLSAGTVPFDQFSFMSLDGSKTLQYKSYESIPKTKGAPHTIPRVLGDEESKDTHTATKEFTYQPMPESAALPEGVTLLLKWLIKL